ncbi:type II secretion system F family protein [Candidatus Omnitrophota bacterium]
MSRFAYVVKNSQGKRRTGIEEAKDKDDLASSLQSKGFFVISILPEEQSAETEVKSTAVKSRHGRLRLEDLVVFARQLATMLDAGVTLLRSIDIINQQVESKVLHTTLQNLKKDLERGLSLSSGLAKYPVVFDQFWVSLSEVGEASGTLPQVLGKMATYLEKRAEFQRKVISAMFYPVILIVLCLAAVAFFAYKIIPTFAGIFKSMNLELPGITLGVLFTFNFIRDKMLLLIVAGAAAFYMIKKYTKTPKGVVTIEHFLFKLPIFGNFFKVIQIERFTSQMSILIESGVPILYTLEITQRMMGMGTMGRVVEQIKNNVREGKLVADPMLKSGFFPPMVVQMIMIGEETGSLGDMLKRISKFYEDYVDTFTQRLTTLFEPVALVVMGFLVGIIVISMFLPIINMATMTGFGK